MAQGLYCICWVKLIISYLLFLKKLLTNRNLLNCEMFFFFFFLTVLGYSFVMHQLNLYQMWFICFFRSSLETEKVIAKQVKFMICALCCQYNNPVLILSLFCLPRNHGGCRLFHSAVHFVCLISLCCCNKVIERVLCI